MRTALRLLLCLIGFAGLLGTGYAWIVSSPTGASPDDDYHQTSIWCPRPIEKHCPIVGTTDQGEPLVEVPQTVDTSSIRYAYQQDTSAAVLDGMDDDILASTSRVDLGDYPGYYYTVMNLLVEKDVDRAILVMRWVNFSLTILLFGGAFLLLKHPGRRLLGYTLLATSLPITIYFTTSVNPTAWALAGIVSAWIGLQGFFTSTSWRRTGLGAIAALGATLAAMSRLDSAMYAVIVSVAMVVLHGRYILAKKTLLLLPLMISMIGAVLFFTTHSTTLTAQSAMIDGPRNPWQVFFTNTVHLPGILVNFWNVDLGWFDVPNPTIVGILAVLITFVIAGRGFIRARCDWHKAAALVIIGGSIFALPVMMMQTRMLYLSEWGIQVRYLAPLIIVFFGLLMTGSPRTDPPELPWQIALGCFSAFIIAHAVLLHTLIRRYVTGMDVTGFNLDINAEWWRSAGPSPMMTWTLGSLGMTCIVFIPCLLSLRPPMIRTTAGESISIVNKTQLGTP